MRVNYASNDIDPWSPLGLFIVIMTLSALVMSYLVFTGKL